LPIFGHSFLLEGNRKRKISKYLYNLFNFHADEYFQAMAVNILQNAVRAEMIWTREMGRVWKMRLAELEEGEWRVEWWMSYIRDGRSRGRVSHWVHRQEVRYTRSWLDLVIRMKRVLKRVVFTGFTVRVCLRPTLVWRICCLRSLQPGRTCAQCCAKHQRKSKKSDHQSKTVYSHSYTWHYLHYINNITFMSSLVPFVSKEWYGIVPGWRYLLRNNRLSHLIVHTLFIPRPPSVLQSLNYNSRTVELSMSFLLGGQLITSCRTD
jgi:hypothetical protein